jgi:hypothetical protein
MIKRLVKKFNEARPLRTNFDDYYAEDVSQTLDTSP